MCTSILAQKNQTRVSDCAVASPAWSELLRIHCDELSLWRQMHVRQSSEQVPPQNIESWARFKKFVIVRYERITDKQSSIQSLWVYLANHIIWRPFLEQARINNETTSWFFSHDVMNFGLVDLLVLACSVHGTCATTIIPLWRQLWTTLHPITQI